MFPTACSQHFPMGDAPAAANAKPPDAQPAADKPATTPDPATPPKSGNSTRRERSHVDLQMASPPRPKVLEEVADIRARHKPFPPYADLDFDSLNAETKARKHRKQVAYEAELLLDPQKKQRDEEVQRKAALELVNAKLRTEVLSQKVRLCQRCGKRIPVGDEFVAHNAKCTEEARAAAERLGLSFHADEFTVAPGQAGALTPEELDALNQDSLKKYLASLIPCEKCGQAMSVVELEAHKKQGDCTAAT